MSSMPASGGLIAARQRPLFESRPRRSPAAVDLHALSRPARSFTGDFYFTHRHGERLWFAVGDVAGKGLPAAVFMAMIQEELEHRITSCARTECDPAATVTRLHEFLRPLMPNNKFATAVIGYLHDDGTLRVSNAGHPPVLIARAGGAVEQIDSTGPVVGMLPQGRWDSVRARLGSGDAVVLYSDGLVEGRSAGGEEFGVNRVVQSLSATAGSSSQTIAAAVTHAFDLHTGGKREDDLTLVVARH